MRRPEDAMITGELSTSTPSIRILIRFASMIAGILTAKLPILVMFDLGEYLVWGQINGKMESAGRWGHNIHRHISL